MRTDVAFHRTPEMSKVVGKRPFTLIELMVVIAVITILMAVLMPVVERAREMGRRSRCASNLRQSQVAISLYANDHDGRIPLGRDPQDIYPGTSPNEPVLPHLWSVPVTADPLREYDMTSGVVRCPSSGRERGFHRQVNSSDTAGAYCVMDYSYLPGLDLNEENYWGCPTWRENRMDSTVAGTRLHRTESWKAIMSDFARVYYDPERGHLFQQNHGVSEGNVSWTFIREHMAGLNRLTADGAVRWAKKDAIGKDFEHGVDAGTWQQGLATSHYSIDYFDYVHGHFYYW